MGPSNTYDKHYLAAFALRYGYQYRVIAEEQIEMSGSTRENNELGILADPLVFLAEAVLGGIAYDVFKLSFQKVKQTLKLKKSSGGKEIDDESKSILETLTHEDELKKFYDYINSYKQGLKGVDEKVVTYIEGEERANFAGESSREVLKEWGIKSVDEIANVDFVQLAKESSNRTLSKLQEIKKQIGNYTDLTIMSNEITKRESTELHSITIDDVKERMITLRGQQVLLDRDVAFLYGVQTKEVNQAVKNNPRKFPYGYLFELDKYEKEEVVKNFDHLNSLKYSKVLPTAFTERGLYMLATILHSDQAIDTTIAIVETFAQIRELSRTMEALQKVADGGIEQQGLLQKTGDILADVVGHNLSTTTTETEIELNFAVVKIKHKIIRKEDK